MGGFKQPNMLYNLCEVLFQVYNINRGEIGDFVDIHYFTSKLYIKTHMKIIFSCKECLKLKKLERLVWAFDLNF